MSLTLFLSSPARISARQSNIRPVYDLQIEHQEEKKRKKEMRDSCFKLSCKIYVYMYIITLNIPANNVYSDTLKMYDVCDVTVFAGISIIKEICAQERTMVC